MRPPFAAILLTFTAATAQAPVRRAGASDPKHVGRGVQFKVGVAAPAVGRANGLAAGGWPSVGGGEGLRKLRGGKGPPAPGDSSPGDGPGASEETARVARVVAKVKVALAALGHEGVQPERVFRHAGDTAGLPVQCSTLELTPK